MHYFKLSCLFIWLLFLLGETGCKEKPHPEKDNFLKSLKNDLETLPENKQQKKKQKKKIDQKTAINKSEEVEDSLKKIGKCILDSVKLFRNDLAAKNIPDSKKLQTKNVKCRNHLYSFVKNHKYINKHYQIYCVLAADYLDKMQRGIEKIKASKKPSQLADLEKQLVKKYNKFALKNNDLAGINILEKKKEYKKTRLAKRTFRDEIARSSKRIGNLLFKWQQKYYPDQDNQDESWKKYPIRTRVYFYFLKNTWEDEKNYLDSISCFNQFSDADKKTDKTDKTDKSETTENENNYNCKKLTEQLNTFREHCKKFISLWGIQLKHGNKPSTLQENKLKLKEEFKKFSTFSQTLPQPL